MDECSNQPATYALLVFFFYSLMSDFIEKLDKIIQLQKGKENLTEENCLEWFECMSRYAPRFIFNIPSLSEIATFRNKFAKIVSKVRFIELKEDERTKFWLELQ
jgi:hypothetical protein